MIKKTTKIISVFREISMWFIFADIVVIVVNIIARRFFSSPIFGVTEIITYMMLCGAAFAIIENEWVDGNVNMMVLLDRMSKKARIMALFIINAATSAGSIIVAYLLIGSFVGKFVGKNMTTELHIPLAIPAAFLAIGFTCLAVVYALKTIIWYWSVKSGEEFNFRANGFLRDARTGPTDFLLVR
jgi:TRAP-type C4-dicarboxylate transport system permease small subunit